MMWEEHPEYQKLQAKMTGLALALLLIAGLIDCILERDWHLLQRLLLFAAGFVFCACLLSGTAWLVVKILNRRKPCDTAPEGKHDEA